MLSAPKAAEGCAGSSECVYVGPLRHPFVTFHMSRMMTTATTTTTAVVAAASAAGGVRMG